ncbi:hypothetical protein [Bdellovibrio sp. HCB274]|uniref:hypothetical protein n=1 Tax=Bdellovibrio sp. HCB274 TaxID=3394361 RepID=UPI0039B5135D
MKMLSFAVTLLMSVSAFAYSTNYTNLEDRTNYIEAVNASNQDGEISLRVVIETDGKVLPTVLVSEQANGFQCKVTKVLLLDSSYNSAKKVFTQSVEAKVIWTPGGENSGCLVEFFHKSLNGTKAVIYMENREANPSPINEDEY